MTCTIYQKQDKPDTLYKYSWLKLIAGLFHLQMNLLRLFHITFQGKFQDQYSLQRFHSVLAQKKVNVKMKYFHACNDFFKMIVQAHIIAFCIYHQGLIKIDNLQTWLSCNNQSNLVAYIKKEYLGLEKIQNAYEGAKLNIFKEVAIKLDARK